MIALSAAEICEIVGGTLTDCDPDLVVDGPVVIDSRACVAGSLFVALAGEHTDGHDHVLQARAGGAVLALVEREVGTSAIVVPNTIAALGRLAQTVLARLRAEGGPTVVGVTGSVGKTTTKDLIAHLLAGEGSVVAPRNSFNNNIGLPLTVLSANAQTRFLVLELGANAPDEIGELAALAPPEVAVVLRVGMAHVGGFGSIDQVAQTKAQLVTALRPGGTAVLNADDPRVAAMAEQAPGPVLTFGTGPRADLRAEQIAAGPDGRVHFRLWHGQDSVQLHSGLFGAHHVTNLLAAAAVGTVLGMPLARIAQRLGGQGAQSAHRMAVTDRADRIRVLDDAYNANPDSVRAALAFLTGPQPAGYGRRIAVLAEMRELGEYAGPAHREIGRVAAELGADIVVAVGSGAEQVYLAAGEAGVDARKVDTVTQAQALMAELLQPGDVVLVKGSLTTDIWRLGQQLAEGGEEKDLQC